MVAGHKVLACKGQRRLGRPEGYSSGRAERRGMAASRARPGSTLDGCARVKTDESQENGGSSWLSWKNGQQKIVTRRRPA
jgi:hypothetical protein